MEAGGHEPCVSLRLRDDLVQPLVLRANLGQCLLIDFINCLDPSKKPALKLDGASGPMTARPCSTSAVWPTRSRRAPLPNRIAGRPPYAVGLKAEQGKLPLSWSESPSAGLALDTRSGELTGTPERAGSFHFAVTVTHGRDRSHTKTFELTVISSGELAITSPSPIPQGIRGQPYSQQLKADGRQGEPGE